MVVDEIELRALVNLREGDIVSRKRVNQVITAMQKRLSEDGYAYAEVRIQNEINEADQKRLSEDGYAYAEVRIQNEINEADKTVSLQFIVIPGRQMRIRYIHFSGNEKTQDVVLRREMRQLEGEMYRRSKIDRSRVRLQRLNYLGSVNIRLVRVPEIEDQIDLEVQVTERFSGNLQLGIGYSQVQGAVVNVGFAHENIFGTGNSLSFTFDNSAASERYALGYENPYYTKDGISRGFNFSFTETDASENNTSNFLIDQTKLSMDFGIPLSEFNRLRLEIGVLRNELETTNSSSDEVFEFVIDNSDKYDESTPNSEIEGDRYDTLFTAVSLAKDTRNRRIFASSGHLNSIRLEVHGGDLNYYKARYRHQSAFALSDTFTFSYKGRIGYGDGYDDTSDLPIFEKFTAGGVRSIRGYDFNSLGPVDSEGDPFGGNLQLITTAEILFPLESLGSSETFRLGIYFDAGNVYEDADSFEASELRQSVGLSAKWFSFIGPIEFSYAWPLNDEPGDDTRNFQFSLGAQF
jgi:outer membrane protein insertion porin family